MATSYTSLLGFALPVTGELDGTWGTVVNNSITQLVEDSVAGVATASVAAGDWTLTTTGSGASNQARCAIIIPTGSPGVSRNIIAPSQSKAYIVINQSNAAVVFKGAATTGVTIAAGTKVLVAWNGSDFVQVGSTGDAVLSANNAFTGANTFYNGTGQTFGTATAAQDGFIIGGRAGGTSTYRITFTPATLSANTTLTFPNTTTTVAGLGVSSQVFTTAQTFRAANAVRSEAASTQDAVVLAGRAGGTSSYAVTLTPTTLSANRTLTLPDADGTIATTATTVSTGKAVVIAMIFGF